MTHALWHTSDHRLELTTGEPAYGHENTLRLAQENITMARTNADNFVMFAMAVYWHRGKWSTDPNNLVLPPEDEL